MPFALAKTMSNTHTFCDEYSLSNEMITMKIKLTLNLEPDVIEDAKQMTEQTGTSISSMLERFVLFMTKLHNKIRPLGPLTQKASGMIALPLERSESHIVQEALLEKHGPFASRSRQT